MKPIKTAVVGLGMGLNFHIPRIAAHPGFELTAVCDINEEKLREAGEQYGAAKYTDYGRMLDESGVELVVLASPTQFHRDHAVAAMERGVDVFLEKPMAKSLTEAQEIAQVMERTGRRLMIYQPHRTFSDNLAVQDVIRSGLLGRIYLIKRRNGCFFARTNWQAYYKNGGGTLFNHGSHYIDELLYVSSGKPVKVSCVLVKVLATGDADDYFKVLITTNTGVLLDAKMSMSAAINQVPWEVYGDRGSAVYTKDDVGDPLIRVRYFTGDAIEMSKYLPTADVTSTECKDGWAVRDFPLDNYPAIHIYDKCYEYYAEGKAPFVPVSETLTVMETLERCKAAAGGLLF